MLKNTPFPSIFRHICPLGQILIIVYVLKYILISYYSRIALVLLSYCPRSAKILKIVNFLIGWRRFLLFYLHMSKIFKNLLYFGAPLFAREQGILRRYVRTFVRITSPVTEKTEINFFFFVKALHIPNFCCTFAR